MHHNRRGKTLVHNSYFKTYLIWQFLRELESFSESALFMRSELMLNYTVTDLTPRLEDCIITPKLNMQTLHFSIELAQCAHMYVRARTCRGAFVQPQKTTSHKINPKSSSIYHRFTPNRSCS